jgi:hypothetical protein
MDLIRVTEAIKSVKGIMPEYPDTPEVAYGMERGTVVHEALSMAARGDLDEATLDPVIAPYLPPWRTWMQQSGVRVLTTEERIKNEALGLSGGIDLVCEIDSRITVVDYKTGAEEEWHRLQTALYAILWQGKVGGPTPSRGSLYLEPGIAPLWRPHVHQIDFTRAKAVLTIAHYLKELHP